MEILTTTITFLLLITLIVSPSFIIFGLNKLNLTNKFLLYLVSGIIITSILTFLFAFWSNLSNKILLSHYGYDFEAMNDIERYRNVAKENLEKVKGLEISIMGIGWPLKAFMVYIVYSPYLLIVYLATYFYKKINRKKNKLF